ncbi:uncharacterized protein [Halyomorpha halys]|uniref:uncharacterized protein n=1 Tax=Halyomorpha halys TaxID=286706 RepID=UPI0006D50524|nr:uncharacterized protein LOC106685944 [Halyomorpha halys]
MISPCWFLLIFAFAAEASTVLDSHYHDLEDLHNELEDYVTGLQRLEIETRETLGRVYELEASRALAKHEENTKMLMRLANQRKCPVSTLLELNQLSDSWTDRFAKCMNLTQKLVYYENVTVAVYYEYLELRPMFCDGVNTVALCVDGTGSLLDKLMCTYQGIQGSINQIDTLKGKVIDTVKYIQSLVTETTKDFLGCFGFHHAAYLSAQNDLISMNC